MTRPKHRYRFVVAYDGTNYSGWQEQKDQPSVAGTMQDVFYRVFRSSIKVVGTSRTDAGVHALGQIGRFHYEQDIDPEQIKKAWNAALPRDIHVRSIERSPTTFHPHHHVAYKEYWYHIFLDRPLPFFARYGHWVRKSFDIEQFRHVLLQFQGTHDFALFSADAGGIDTVCTISSISCIYVPAYQAYRILIKGNRFRQHMVRRIVGAALAITCNVDRSIGDIQMALNGHKPEKALPTAPAHGLLLRRVVHKT
jgi:tRNA pseudouridine38-40 synthase